MGPNAVSPIQKISKKPSLLGKSLLNFAYPGLKLHISWRIMIQFTFPAGIPTRKVNK